jgi:hypothetical protein
MAFKFNPITGVLDIVETSSITSGVTGIAPTVVNAIAIWGNTSASIIENSLTYVQTSGAIEAQMFITRQDITGPVTINQDECAVVPALNLTLTGSIDLTGGGSLEIV